MSVFIEAVQKPIKPENLPIKIPQRPSNMKNQQSNLITFLSFLITPINQHFLPISPISPGNHQSDSSCQFRHWLVISNDHGNPTTV